MRKQKTTKVDLVETARQLRLQAEALERKASMAKGTQQNVVKRNGNVVVKPTRSPYYVGDTGPTEQLMAVVLQALTEHPLTFQDLLEATGARDNRIKGVIMRLQREGVRVVNVGTASRAIWFIPSDEVLKRIMAAKKAATERR